MGVLLKVFAWESVVADAGLDSIGASARVVAIAFGRLA